MIEQQARVVKCEGHSIWLSTEAQSGCGSCQVNGTCGTSIVAQLFPKRPEQLLKLNHQDAKQAVSEGDSVLVGIDESYLQNTSLLLYAVPLLTLFSGAIFGNWIGQSYFSAGIGELTSIILGLLGLMAGFVFVRKQSRKREQKLENIARIIRVNKSGFSVEIPKFPA